MTRILLDCRCYRFNHPEILCFCMSSTSLLEKLCLPTVLISVCTTILRVLSSSMLVVESACDPTSLSSKRSKPSWSRFELSVDCCDRGWPVPLSPLFDLGSPVNFALKLLFLNKVLNNGARHGRFADMMADCISMTVHAPGWAWAYVKSSGAALMITMMR